MTDELLSTYGEFPNPHEVRFVRVLPAPVARVWAFLTDSEKRATWLAGGPMDVHLHGHVRLKFDHAALSPHEVLPGKYEEGELTQRFDGEINFCEPPNRLSFTWQGGSEVCFEMNPIGEETRLILHHSGLKNIAETISAAAGWHIHVAYLIARLTGQEPPPFWATHARLEEEYAARLVQFAPTGTGA